MDGSLGIGLEETAGAKKTNSGFRNRVGKDFDASKNNMLFQVEIVLKAVRTYVYLVLYGFLFQVEISPKAVRISTLFQVEISRKAVGISALFQVAFLLVSTPEALFWVSYGFRLNVN
jgi:hypothetical protein